MRIFKTLLIIAVAICVTPAYAQSDFIKWSSNPSTHKLPADKKDLSAVVLEDFRFHEYKADEKDNMFVYCEQRKLVKVNDLKGVEMFNKIYVYMSDNAELITLKARTILPGGKVIDLPASKVLDVEEDGRRYKKFAMEGVENGAEIEYYTMIRKSLYTFGIENFSLTSAPIQHAAFALSVPDHLYFDVKGYNGFTVSKDTIINNKRLIYAHASNTPFFEEEKYSTADPYYTNVQYKLSYNLAKDKQVRMNTWSELAKNVYTGYNQFDSKELKLLGNYFKKISLPAGISDAQRIAMIEDHVKSNINIVKETIEEDADELEKIIKSKVASNFGVTRLLIGLYNHAGLNTSIVFPSKRNETPIDETFENYRLIADALIFFPVTGGFLDPVNTTLRYPVINPTWGGTRGLFIRETSIGSLKTALADFDSIPLLPYEQNSTNMDVSIRLNKTLDTLELTSKQILSGYSASVYRPAYLFLEKDRQDEFTKEVIHSVAKSDSISSFSVENTSMADTYKNLPLNILGEIKSVELIERAGKNILIKLGEVIGPQAQMYQEKKRQLPIMIEYPHALDRTIRLTIPKGYKVKNLNDLKFNITDKNANGVETMGFISEYSLDGQELTVKVHEFYKEISYDINMIEVFKNVINAAADFNKVVLALEEI